MHWVELDCWCLISFYGPSSKPGGGEHCDHAVLLIVFWIFFIICELYWTVINLYIYPSSWIKVSNLCPWACRWGPRFLCQHTRMHNSVLFPFPVTISHVYFRCLLIFLDTLVISYQCQWHKQLWLSTRYLALICRTLFVYDNKKLASIGR